MKPITTKITLTYLLIGLVWIFISDWLIYQVIFNDPYHLVLTQNVKGVFFVLITAVLIFFILHKNEKNFKNLENQYEHSFYKNPVPIGIYKIKDLSFVALNNAAVKILGFSRDEMESMTILDIIPQEDIPIIKKRLEEGFNSKSNTGIWRLQTKKGSIIHVSMITTQTFFEGDECRMVMAIDAEEFLANQHQLKFKEDQISAIQHISSHQVRRHLANLLALSKLVEKLSPKEIADEQIGKKIEFSAKMLDKEIKNLVDEASRQVKKLTN